MKHVQASMKRRKQPTPPPPGRYIRTRANGIPARLVKTSHINAADEWLYRLDFGDVIAPTLWSWQELERLGVTFLTERPTDLRERTTRDPETEENP